MAKYDVRSFVVNVLTTVTAGLILALALFCIREFAISVPVVDGPWHCLTKTTETDYSGYKNMLLGWRMVLTQSNGTGVEATVEKMWEHNRGLLEGVSIHRGRGSGFIRHNFVTESKLLLQQEISPKNTRQSSIIFDMNGFGRSLFDNMQESERNLNGSFYWTVANQEGVVACQRERPDWDREEDRRALLAEVGG